MDALDVAIEIFKIIDKPDNYRKLHINPTPSIGGLIIYLNFLPSLLFFNDDLKDIKDKDNA